MGQWQCARRGGTQAAPNHGLELTASSVRWVRRASGRAECGNTSGIQVLDEPLELSVVDHSTA
jgi:hypothetical protein